MPESATLIATITNGATMDAAAVATIGALVTALTTIIKRSLPGDWDCYGLLIASLTSAAGVFLWLISAPNWPPLRTDAWAIGAAYVSVLSTAIGLYELGKVATKTPPLRRRRQPESTVPDGA